MSRIYKNNKYSQSQSQSITKYHSGPKIFRRLFKDRISKQTLKQKINLSNLSSFIQKQLQSKQSQPNQASINEKTLNKKLNIYKLHDKRLTQYVQQKSSQNIYPQNDDKLSVKSFSSTKSFVSRTGNNQNKNRTNTKGLNQLNNSNIINENNKLKSYVRQMKLNQTLNSNNFKNVAIHKKSQKNIASSYSRNTVSQLYESKSNQSQKSYSRISNINFIQERDQDMRSVTSLLQSRQMSRTNILLSKFLANQINEDNKSKISNFNLKQTRIKKLNILQQKLEKLTKNKLNAFLLNPNSNHRLTSKQFFSSGSSSLILQRNQLRTPTKIIYPYNQNNIIDRQIQSIIKCISNLKQKQDVAPNNESSTDQLIYQVNKKIQLLEKLIATSSTQSQILKNYYFAIKSQKHSYLSRRQKLFNQIAKRKPTLEQNSTLKFSINKTFQKPVVKLQTTTSYFYKKPQLSAYKIDKQSKNNSFCINRQPLPRSIYGREFLNYGTVPTFNCKPQDQTLNVPTKMLNATTNYQQDFKEKNQNLKQIDYRELDCFRNKIKAPKISLNQLLNKKNPAQKKKKIIVNKVTNDINKQQTKYLLNDLLDNTNDKKMYNSLMKQSKNLTKFKGQSQMKRQFTNCWNSLKTTEQNQQALNRKKEIPKNLLMSLSKNGNLDKLKAAYKINFVR